MILAIKIYNSLLCCKKTKKKAKDLTTRDRLLKLYQKGRERYEKDLSIDRIIRNLRAIRILFLNQSQNMLKSNEVVYHDENVIHLDNDTGEVENKNQVTESNSRPTINNLLGNLNTNTTNPVGITKIDEEVKDSFGSDGSENNNNIKPPYNAFA